MPWNRSVAVSGVRYRKIDDFSLGRRDAGIYGGVDGVETE